MLKALLGIAALMAFGSKKATAAPRDTGPGSKPPTTTGGTMRTSTPDPLAMAGDLIPMVEAGVGLLGGGGGALGLGGATAAHTSGGTAAAAGGAGGAAGTGATLLGPGTQGVLGATGTVIGGVAATGVALAASGAIGYAMTGDVGGAAGGAGGFIVTTLVPGTPMGGGILVGQAGNVGRLLGREIDRLLGGDGSTGTGIVNQVTGYIGGLALAVVGLSALPFIGQTFLIVAGIASLISDASRLAYGQAGMTADTMDEAAGYYDATLPEIRELVKTAFGLEVLEPADEVRISLFTFFQTQGYVEQQNGGRKRMWVDGRPRGVGVSAAYHEQFGRDRGYWVENLSLVMQALYARVNQATGQAMGLGARLYDVVVSGSLNQQAAVGQRAVSAIYTEATAICDRLYERGRLFANMNAYLTWMRTTWGGGQSAYSHAVWGRDNQKAFLGSIDSQGNLTWQGKTVLWQAALANDPNFFVDAMAAAAPPPSTRSCPGGLIVPAGQYPDSEMVAIGCTRN